MQEEIKLLLQYLKNVYDSEETSTWLNKLQIKELLDYITNLQEENTNLKELCDKYEEEHSTTFEEWKKDIKANKKAIRQIEIILEMALEQDSENVNLIDRLKGILNILKGDNK